MRAHAGVAALVWLLAPAAAAQTAAPEPPPATASASRLFDFGALDTQHSIEIEARELEAVTLADGGRRLSFRDDVRVVQGESRLRCNELDAWYPPGESQPERLAARGAVEIVQGDRRARCDEAVYLRSAQKLTCVGGAQLIQACDVVRGEEIEFDLARDRVHVTGAAVVRIHPKGAGSDPACPGSDL